MASNTDEENNALCARIGQFRFIGYIAIVLSSMFFAFIAVGVNLLENDMNPIQTLIVSYIIVGFIYFSIIIFADYSFKPFPGEGKALLIRCVVGALTSFATYMSVTLLKLGDATAIIQSAPIFVIVIAFIFLREPCEIIQIVLIAFSFVGVILIAKPSFLFSYFSHIKTTQRNSTATTSEDNTTLYGLLLANAAAIGNAGFTVALRRLKVTPIPVTIFWTSFTITIFSAAYLAFIRDIRVPISSTPYLLILFTATCIMLAQHLQTLALRIEKAGPIALVRQVQVVFAFIDQIVILKQEVQYTSIFGAVIIVSAAIITGLYQMWRNSGQNDNNNKQLTATKSEQTITSSNSKLNETNENIKESKNSEAGNVNNQPTNTNQ